jgi:Glycosyl transferase family 2
MGQTLPTISVAMPAYQAERWIGETLESVLAQTSPPDEVIVVDDGSTDDTAVRAEAFGERVRVVRQANAGAPAAYNRAFRESTSDYVAMCPADDLWEPHKLEYQREVIAEHPDVDVTFGGACFFGLEDRDYPGPAATGLLERERFIREMYVADVLPAPTAVVRRELFDRLGGFRDDLPAEDYEFWMRALKHGATFFHDPRLLVRLRQHGGNLSAQTVPMWEMNLTVHELYADELGDAQLARRMQALDLRSIGRAQLGLGQVAEARRSYRASLGHFPHAAGLAWTLLLSAPGAAAPLRGLAARRRARDASAR